MTRPVLSLMGLSVASAALSLSAPIAGAVVATGSGWRRLCGVGIALLAWVAPWVAPAAWPGLRTMFVLAAVVVTMRIIEVARMDWSLARRVVHALSLMDPRRMHSVPRRLDLRGLAVCTAWSAVGAAGIVLVIRASPAAGSVGYWSMRWLGALVAAYAVTEATYVGLLPAIYRGLGRELPRLHRSPGAARSVTEFWGSRWNLTITHWFRQCIFTPLARAGWPRAGMALAFAASAVMHAYIALVAAGLVMAGIMLAYFLVQGALALIERPLGVPRWSPIAGHAWTIALMTATSPMFTEPFLRCVGIGPSAG
ncbi:MAG TPA: MBOAT family protein [Polyangiaceae bacterium]